ncbi:MAG: hypothetical protein ACRD9R_11170 [Pyrinomonadaceae bacterium]
MVTMFRTLAVIFACCIMIIILLLLSVRHSGRVTSYSNENPLRQNYIHQNLTFTATTVFDGKTKDGAQYTNQIFKSSDCVTVSKMIVFFNSPARALDEIQRENKKASVIIDRGPKLDNNGQQVGERVVLQFAIEGQRQAHAEVIWNENLEFHSVIAPSLQHVLEFEKWLHLPKNEKASLQNETDQVITFESTRTFAGKTEDGFVFSDKQFQTSDCATITMRTEVFDSSTRAHEELQKKLKGAINILEGGPKLNAAGKQVGQRAVIIIPSAPSYEYLALTAVIWTENSEVHSIHAPSLRHALEFEKSIHP